MLSPTQQYQQQTTENNNSSRSCWTDTNRHQPTNPHLPPGAVGSLVFSRPAITTCNLRSSTSVRSTCTRDKSQRRRRRRERLFATRLLLTFSIFFSQVRCLCHTYTCKVYVSQSKTTDDIINKKTVKWMIYSFVASLWYYVCDFSLLIVVILENVPNV